MEENFDDLYIDEYFMQIARELEVHDVLFYFFWDLGKPKFTKEINTACVSFDNEGNFVSFMFNPDFWMKSSHIKRKFIICHEILHVLFKHGKRMVGSDPHLNNIAMDISINHTLINKFGFRKEDIEDWEQLCFVETIFKNQNIPNDKNFEYYYELLADGNEENNADDMESLDEHSKNEDDDSVGQILKQFSESTDDKMNDEDKENWKDIIEQELIDNDNEGLSNWVGQEAGHGESFYDYFLKTEKIKPKKKWETIITKWVNNHITYDLKQEESWLVQNKRFTTINTDFSIPYENEDEYLTNKKDKINLFFFQDVSGSCIHLVDRFFKAASSIPKERFNIRTFIFDTNVLEIDLKDKKIHIGGGTSFSVIEQYIQFIIKKEKIKYPSAVFVITDGYGNMVKPEKPENWYWFLNTTYKNYIPKESKVYNLKDFE